MNDRWVTGDHSGLPFPADPASLLDGGTPFLTTIFRAPVDRIIRYEEVSGGSTGRKVLVLISDGGNTVKGTTYQQALEQALRGEVMVYPIIDVDDALQLADSGPYGLCASLFTESPQRWRLR